MNVNPKLDFKFDIGEKVRTTKHNFTGKIVARDFCQEINGIPRCYNVYCPRHGQHIAYHETELIKIDQMEYYARANFPEDYTEEQLNAHPSVPQRNNNK